MVEILGEEKVGFELKISQNTEQGIKSVEVTVRISLLHSSFLVPYF